VDGSGILADLRSLLHLGKEKGEIPLPENATADPAQVIYPRRGLVENQVREGAFRPTRSGGAARTDIRMSKALAPLRARALRVVNAPFATCTAARVRCSRRIA
jgi:hypothetical protein